jgi:hypothetical protein
MTSQRDETTPRPAGEGVADDPIIVERRDEILAGEGPALEGDGEGYGPAAGDELVGRHAVPDTSGMDPAPLVVPAESAAADSAPADTGAADTGAAEMGTPGTGGFQAGRPGTGRPGTGSPTAYDPATSGPATSGVTVPGRGAPDSASFGSESADPDDQGSPETSSAPATRDEPDMDEPGIGEPGMEEPGGPETPEPAVPGPAAAATGPGIPAAALSEQQWPAIQAMFVDDPKGSVQRAAGAADEVVKAFVASLEREQAALRAAWENGATTEDLRTALQQYRAFCGRLEGLA